jgi:DNA-binding NarL/FixJ family response regulator
MEAPYAATTATAMAGDTVHSTAPGHARRIRVLLVDDQPVIRRGLRMWLELDPEIEIAGEASDGHEAVRAAAAIRPDVVLMDVEMPGLDGIAATAALRATCPETAVIVQSLHEDAPTRARALAAGAVAFVGKGTGEGELLSIIRRLRQVHQSEGP